MKRFILLVLVCCSSSVFSSNDDLASCKTQSYLSKQSYKSLFNLSPSEMYNKLHDVKNRRNNIVLSLSYGACSLKISDIFISEEISFQSGVVTTSNNATLYSSALDFDQEDQESRQVEIIKNGMDTMKKALASCGCTRL